MALLWLLAAAAPAPASESGIPPVDALDQPALQEVFRLLRQNYIQRDKLTLLELNRAALEGLLRRLDFGAEILPATATAAPAPSLRPLLAEMVAEGIGCLRPGSYSPAELEEADAALERLTAEGARHLVLDLRAPAPHGEFSTAAAWADRFLPAGELLFELRETDGERPRSFRSSRPVRWDKPVVILIDAESNNVAETLAAVLIRRLGSRSLGTPTAGRTMQYTEAPIGAGMTLRFASAEMILPDGSSLYRRGLTPSLLVPQETARKSAAFATAAVEGLKATIQSVERPRMNERALVAGEAPELPYELTKAAGDESPFDSPPDHDLPLRQAVDILTALHFLKTP